MVNTKEKYHLVEIGKLKPGALFYTSKEAEDAPYTVSNVRLLSQPDIIIGVGVETGVRLGWRKNDLVYVKEGAGRD